jgi:hypothetical protein
MTPEEFKTTVEYGQFLTDLRRQFLANYREEFSQLIRYGETLMGTLAVIAGFGFTAFQFINSLTLFFAGEILVIFSILYLIYKTKTYIVGQPISTEKWINDSINKVRDIKKALLENNELKIKTLAAEFQNSASDTSTEMPELQASKNIGNDLKNAFWLGSVGIVLIISSFIICL